MNSKISEYGPLTVGPMNSVFPASHIAFKDGRWVELVDDPVCIATFAQDEIGSECARMLAAYSHMLAALQQALNDWPDWENGEPVNGGDMVEWFGTWRETAKAAVAKAEGRANG